MRRESDHRAPRQKRIAISDFHKEKPEREERVFDSRLPRLAGKVGTQAGSAPKVELQPNNVRQRRICSGFF